MSESEEKQTDVRQQAQQIDRELQSLQQQLDAVDQEMTPDRMNEIIQVSEQIAADLEQPQKD